MILNTILSGIAYQTCGNNRNPSCVVKLGNIFAVTVITAGLILDPGSTRPCFADSKIYQTPKVTTSSSKGRKESKQTPQSPGWELARLKRTAAMKAMQTKGIIKIDTDDSGNQYLKLPWVPNQRLPYKSLSITQRLQGEVCAGAIGELSKDALLHALDTAKTRKQVLKKATSSMTTVNSTRPDLGQIIKNTKALYAGFPIVLASSIPQGGIFFLVKKGMAEILNVNFPATPSVISSTLPIGFGVMAYWLFRTPAEVIKTRVQTFQSPNCKAALLDAKDNDEKGLLGLWKHYNVMLTLDVPFQVLNFVLLGFVSDAVLSAGYETSILTRLFCGVTCGMITAAVTCPIDVCKTRIITRDRKKTEIVDEVKVLNSQPISTPSHAESITEFERFSTRNEVYTIDEDFARSRDGWMSDIGQGRLALGQDRDRGIGLLERQERQTVVVAMNQLDQVVPNTESDIGAFSHPAPMSPADTVHVPQTVGVTAESNSIYTGTTLSPVNFSNVPVRNNSVIDEMFKIIKEEGVGALFLGINQRLLYVGLANGIRLAAYGTSRVDLMMKSLDDL